MPPPTRANSSSLTPPQEGVLSVSQLARQARLLIEEHLGSVTVEGELSNFSKPRSGHWYFTLKDQNAQIRCAMFAGRNRLVNLAVADGLQVRVGGRVSLYEPRGDFQLIVERMEAAGEGALRAAFDALQKQLAAEGLFEPARKRQLPVQPRHLTIISSPSGAALRDVLHVIERRFPGLEVVLIPSAVQGATAEAQLVRALQQSAGLATDVVLLTRGGGSLEDLWAFNLESVARAVAACPHPIVSAIGHQTDFAITDFVADVRAPTPSAAAELITPDVSDLEEVLSGRQKALARAMGQELRFRGQQLSSLDARLVDPATLVAQKMVQADELEARLQRAWSAARQVQHGRLRTASRSLSLLKPARLIEAHQSSIRAAALNLGGALRQSIARRQLLLAGNARALSAVSPLNTLHRGYAVLESEPDQPQRRRTVTSIAETAPGAKLRALLADGSLELAVTGINETPPLVAPEVDTED